MEGRDTYKDTSQHVLEAQYEVAEDREPRSDVYRLGRLPVHGAWDGSVEWRKAIQCHLPVSLCVLSSRYDARE